MFKHLLDIFVNPNIDEFKQKIKKSAIIDKRFYENFQNEAWFNEANLRILMSNKKIGKIVIVDNNSQSFDTTKLQRRAEVENIIKLLK